MAKARKAADKRGKTRILIVEARYYDDISTTLLTGATRALDEAGAAYDKVTVPGALEIPAAVEMAVDAAARKKEPYDGVVALGCVIQGETFHFDIVSMQSARALLDVSVARQLPVGNGILTVDTESQAWARARVEEGDKGGAAARTTLAMVELKRSLTGKK